MYSKYEMRLAQIRDAIRSGKAFLATYLGRRKVVGYNPDTGRAVTQNDNEPDYNRMSFMVCSDEIEID